MGIICEIASYLHEALQTDRPEVIEGLLIGETVVRCHCYVCQHHQRTERHISGEESVEEFARRVDALFPE